MRVNLSTLIKTNPTLALGFWVGILCLVVQWILVVLFVWRLPPEIPMWYSLPSGRLQIGSGIWFWLLPGLSLIFGLINLTFLQFGGGTVKIYSSLQLWLTSVVMLLATIAMINILRLTL